MENNLKPRPKAWVDRSLCGCCAKVCPLTAISVFRGLWAQVDSGRCVGCGRCVKECPASVIELKEAGT